MHSVKRQPIGSTTQETTGIISKQLCLLPKGPCIERKITNCSPLTQLGQCCKAAWGTLHTEEAAGTDGPLCPHTSPGDLQCVIAT